MATRKVYSSGGKSSSYHLGGAHKSINEVAKPADAVPHNGVSFAELKKHCLKEGVLFEDPDFPAVDASLFFSKKTATSFCVEKAKGIYKHFKIIQTMSRRAENSIKMFN